MSKRKVHALQPGTVSSWRLCGAFGGPASDGFGDVTCLRCLAVSLSRLWCEFREKDEELTTVYELIDERERRITEVGG